MTDDEKKVLIGMQIRGLQQLLKADYKWSYVVDHTGKSCRKLTFTIND